jgi:hypothetical protein
MNGKNPKKVNLEDFEIKEMEQQKINNKKYYTKNISH